MNLEANEFSERRAALAAQLPVDSLVLVPAARVRYRNRDAEYLFRQDSDFLYLTGFPEPDAWLALQTSDSGCRTTLFVLPRDPEKEIWTGYRAGPEGARQQYGADQAFELAQLDECLVALMNEAGQIYFPFSHEQARQRVMTWHQQAGSGSREAVASPQTLVNIEPLLHEQRLIKRPAEIEAMRYAAKVSADAHRQAMQCCRPGLMEYQLEAELHYHFAQQGCRTPAYGTIVGGGANGCILHYTENQSPLQAGELVLIDAGCESQGYAGDITRTFPVDGRFSDAQRQLYQLVLDAQLAAIAAVKPGAGFDDPHQQAVAVLTEGLLQMGLLDGELEQLIEQEAYKPFYMHRTSHWLGLDVHDVGDYKQNGEWRQLQPGMVLTIEPGLYIAPDNEQVAPCWRGIGIRIEDDVLVTEQGAEVLTAGVPKAIDEIEQLMAAS